MGPRARLVVDQTADAGVGSGSLYRAIGASGDVANGEREEDVGSEMERVAVAVKDVGSPDLCICIGVFDF